MFQGNGPNCTVVRKWKVQLPGQKMMNHNEDCTNPDLVRELIRIALFTWRLLDRLISLFQTV